MESIINSRGKPNLKICVMRHWSTRVVSMAKANIFIVQVQSFSVKTLHNRGGCQTQLVHPLKES